MIVEFHFGNASAIKVRMLEADHPYGYIEGNGLSPSLYDSALSTIRDNRFALVEEILARPLYTLNDL